MPNNLVLPGQVPQHVAQSRAAGSSLNLNANASAGLSGGFPVLSLMGKEWKTKFRGTDTLLPSRELHVIVVGMPAGISKSYYVNGWVQDSKDAPDCFSLDGIEPDPASPKRQSNLCATCYQNRFGSRPATAPGRRAGKACADQRRLALIMYDNAECKGFDSPLLLRLPQQSTQTLDKYCRQLAAGGADITQVVTTMSFTPGLSYPVVEFHAAGWVDDGIYPWVEHWARSPEVDRMIFDAPVVEGGDYEMPASTPTLLQAPLAPPPPRPAPQQASPFAVQQAPQPGNGAVPAPPPPAPPAPAAAPPPSPPAPAQAQAAPERRGPGRPPGARNLPKAPPQQAQAPTPPPPAPQQAAPPPPPAPAPVQRMPVQEPAPANVPAQSSMYEDATTPGPVIQDVPKNMVTIIDGLLD